MMVMAVAVGIEEAVAAAAIVIVGGGGEVVDAEVIGRAMGESVAHCRAMGKSIAPWS